MSEAKVRRRSQGDFVSVDGLWFATPSRRKDGTGRIARVLVAAVAGALLAGIYGLSVPERDAPGAPFIAPR